MMQFDNNTISSYPATILGKDHLVDILEELWDVSSKWYNIGLKLKLSVGTLESLKADPSTALREMLLLWLKKVDPLPTWEGLACALESRTVGEPRLAEQLRTKYCKTEEAAEGAAGQLLYISKCMYIEVDIKGNTGLNSLSPSVLWPLLLSCL